MRPVLGAFATSLLAFAAAGAAGQNYDPASGKSPLVLTQVPTDGIAYFEAKEKARALYRADGDWAAAESLLDRLAKEYPRDPENWMMLSRTKRRLGKHDEAAVAADKARAIVDQADYLIALNLYQEGDRKGALDALRRAIFERHGIIRQRVADYFPGLAPLKSDPEFRRIVGDPDTSGWTRQQGRLFDLDFLYNEVKRVNPEYRDEPFPPEFDRRYQALRSDVGKLSDEELFVGMQRMLAVLRQGHLALWADETARVPNRFLPLRLYVFPEGIFIIDAKSSHEQLIGAEVLAIGSITAEEALRRLAEANSVDGDMEHLWAAPRLAQTYYLRGFGAIDGVERVPLRIRSRSGRISTVMIAAEPKAPPSDLVNRVDKLLAPAGVAAPLFLSNMKASYWHKPLPEQQALYVQVNNLIDTEQETLDQYGDRLWRAIGETAPKNLILDLRHNNGGTTQLYPNLLRTLVAFSRVPGNQVYAIIGRRTYSAAGNFVTDLERLTDPIFVGEASSECCNLHGDPTEVVLPYSKVMGELTAMKWNLSQPLDGRREISPEVPVQLTARAYFSGQDPALDAIFELIKRRR